VLFVLVICVFMLNLVLTNCYIMRYTHSQVVQLPGIYLRFDNFNHPVISTGYTHIQISPTLHYFLPAPGY
jgi:hypothetical protein